MTIRTTLASRCSAAALAVSALALALPALAAPAPAAPAYTVPAGDRAPTFDQLPDWKGVWEPVGSTLFDQSRGTIQVGAPNARGYPPYKPDWEAAYTKFLNDVVYKGQYVDPLNMCFPIGFPRYASVTFGMQFFARPEGTAILYERWNGRFVFTDGRPHPEDLWPSWEGHSIGHWEGDTLVVETVGMKGGVPVDRTGLIFSDELRVIERIYRRGDELIDDLTLIDPVAFTGPWNVTRRYKKVEGEFPTYSNIACTENERNPVLASGQNTVLLGSEAQNGLYPTNITPYSAFKPPPAPGTTAANQ